MEEVYLCAFDKVWYPSISRNILNFSASIKDPCMLKSSGSESQNSYQFVMLGERQVELSCNDLCFPCSPRKLFHQVLQSHDD